MTLVSGDDRVAVRVGPKVFADIPTAAEMDGLRKGRSFALLLCVLFAGAAAACVAIAIYFSGYPAKLDAAERKYDTDTARLQQDIDGLKATNAQYVDYNGIISQRGVGDPIRSEIRRMLVQKPGALRGAIQRGWDQSETGIWPNLRSAAERDLGREVEVLQTVRAYVSGWQGPAVCSDPRGCPPGVPGR